MTSANFLSRIEHGMVVAHGVPVQVLWSFASSRIECVRLDGFELTPSMERTFARLLENAGEDNGGNEKWSN